MRFWNVVAYMYLNILLISVQQATGGNIMFVRGETQGQDRDGTDTTRVVNPEEIDIDDDDVSDQDSDNEDEDGKVYKYLTVCNCYIHIITQIIIKNH